MLDEMRRGKLGEPIGFWRFVIIATVVMTILRSMLFKVSLTGSSLFPFAVVLYLVYRIARLQPSWPFRVPEGELKAEPQSEAVGRTLKTPVNADYLKSLGKKVKKAKSAAETSSMGLQKYVQPVFDGVDLRMSPKQINDSLVSSVGVRGKATRSKTVREKTVRRRRRS